MQRWSRSPSMEKATEGLRNGGSIFRGDGVRTFRSRGTSRARWFEPPPVRTLIYVCMHVHPWFESLRSSNVSITWGARPHTSRNGGSGVNRGPPLRFPRMSPGVRRLAPLVGPVGLSREGAPAPPSAHPPSFRLSGSLGACGESRMPLHATACGLKEVLASKS